MKIKTGLMVVSLLMLAELGFSQNQNDARHVQVGTDDLHPSVAVSEQVHVVPFASQNNSIELTIANRSNVAATGVNIMPGSLPSWMHLTPGEYHLDQLKANSEQIVEFTFSVDKEAPVNREQKLTFTITTSNGEEWKKEITIKVRLPEKFELFQNYPNPFNPATTVEYTLPKDARVKLVVFNTLGQEVARLVDGNQDAGYQSVVWNASNIPSGVYFYKIDAVSTDRTNTRFSEVKKMMVVK